MDAGDLDIGALRAETPGTSERIHLNNAGAGLMSSRVMTVVRDYIELEGRLGGYEVQAASADAIQGAYRSVATLLGAQPRHIAFTENATAAFAQALSSIPFRPGDVILTTSNDYASNQIQFLSLQKRFGIHCRRAPDDASGCVDTDAMSDMIRTLRPRLVCVTQVPTNSGLVQDVAGIGASCREHDTLYAVDACQSVGQMPVDVAAIGCDFLSATARKFLRGPRGCGFLYVSDRVLDAGYEPLFIDMHGANWIGPDAYTPVDSARRFENFEFNWGLVLGTGAAAAQASALGLDCIQARVRSLADYLRGQLDTVGGARLLHSGEDQCGIVTLAVAGRSPIELVRQLRAEGINTSAQERVHAVIDYDRVGAGAALRISPHYYNTGEEIDQVVTALERLTG